MEFVRTNYKKVLKILGILLALAIFLYIASYFLDNNPDITNFKVTNLSSNSLTLAWESTNPNIATVQYSTDNNWQPLTDKLFPKNLAYDDRDLIVNDSNQTVFSSEKAFPRTLHHVTIRNLDSSTTYYFRLNGYTKTFALPTESVTTYAEAQKVDTPDPVYGKIRNHYIDLYNPTDGIVYYKVVNNNQDLESQLYSSIIGNDSGWSGDLSDIRDTTGAKFSWDKENYKLSTEVFSLDGYAKNIFSLDSYKPIETSVVIDDKYLSNIEKQFRDLSCERLINQEQLTSLLPNTSYTSSELAATSDEPKICNYLFSNGMQASFTLNSHSISTRDTDVSIEKRADEINTFSLSQTIDTNTIDDTVGFYGVDYANSNTCRLNLFSKDFDFAVFKFSNNSISCDSESNTNFASIIFNILVTKI